MLKHFVTIFFLCSVLLSQNFTIFTNFGNALETEPSILDSVRIIIENSDSSDFFIFNGNLTSKGKVNEFSNLYDLQNFSESPLYFLGGENDYAKSAMGGFEIIDIWDAENFIFSSNNNYFIGLNSSLPWHIGEAHIPLETIYWLDEKLESLPSGSNIILIISRDFYNIDNFSDLINRFEKYNLKLILSPFNEIVEKDKDNLNGLVFTNDIYDGKSKIIGFSNYRLNNDTLTIMHKNVSGNIISKSTQVLSNIVFNFPEKTDSLELFDAKLIMNLNLGSTMIAEPLIIKDKILTATKNGIIALYDTTGKMFWDYDAFGDVYGSPAFADGIVAVANIFGDLQTLKLINGNQIQSIGFDEPITSPLTLIDYTGDKKLMIPKKTNSNKAIIAGTASGKLYCFDLETLEQIWVNKDAKGMLNKKPLILGDKIFIPAWNGVLYCINAKNGLLIWKRKFGDEYLNSPTFSELITNGSTLFISTPDEYVYSIDAQTGLINWKTNKYNAVGSIGISENQKYLYVKDVESRLWIISANRGQLFHHISSKYGRDINPTTIIQKNDFIYFTASNSNIYRINKKYYYKTIFSLTNTELFPIRHLSGQKFVTSTVDGRIIIFSHTEDK